MRPRGFVEYFRGLTVLGPPSQKGSYMSIGFFVDGSFVYKSYPDQIDYLKLRQQIEKELSDTVDEV